PLASGSLSAATVLPAGAVEIPITSAATGSPHDMAAAQCGTCHRGHAAKGPSLLAQSTQSALCFSCHNGTAGANVAAQYALARPVNDPAAREYYSHDEPTPAVTPAPTQPGLDEFNGVSNRRTQCADCHNSHQANGTDSIETPDGWTASGRLAGVSGVSVENGAAGTAPKYTLLSGLDTNVVTANLVTREYQLCFKCHSGSTTLLPPIVGKPSKDALDKGVEFNPANPSFHPVEAKGTNDTGKMTDSLAGSSPYKLWNFNVGSTIRCLNCHAGGATDPTATPPLPQPGSSLAPHTSSNRGILLENYRDRVLKPSAAASATDAAYSAGDFALCYVCHAEAPFANKNDPADGSSNATNFKLHGLHLTGLATKGDKGTDIDTAGDGQGNAICAECHFRIHSTTNKVGDQAISGKRLVNFAPNVLPVAAGGTLSWTAGTPGGGSCALTCHGKTHTPGDFNY
ncbi:MAG: cytochrome c3 family protein, partial [Dermatophilaceae bacterium]